MRVVNFEIFSVFLLLCLEADIEVEAENQQGVVTRRLSDTVRTDLEPGDMEILKAIKEGYVRIKDITRKIGRPVSTTWRRVNRLVKERYLEKDGEMFRLTTKGEILVQISDVSREVVFKKVE